MPFQNKDESIHFFWFLFHLVRQKPDHENRKTNTHQN